MNRDAMGLIVKRDDGSEIVNYDDQSFPSYIYDGWIEPNAPWERVPHFHEDIEMMTVKSGKLMYSVNGKNLLLNEGDTIFINSNQIHYNYCIDGGSATYVIFVAHPSILMSSVPVEMQAIRPIIDNPDIPYIRFRYKNEFTEAVRNIMNSLPEKRHDPFEITLSFFRIWDLIRKQSACYGATEEVASDPHMRYFKMMNRYITESYASQVTLDKIAQSAGISRSLCNTIFKDYVNESPVTYLMRFRARKVAEHLRSNSGTLTEIAAMTGFGGTSYMSETFRKFFGMSPSDYKKKYREISAGGGYVPAPGAGGGAGATG